MPLFEDPANFSKSRLKSDLISHNVSLPPADSKKQVYVELHLKHIEQKNAADFSSDEEDQEQDMPVSRVTIRQIRVSKMTGFGWRELFSVRPRGQCVMPGARLLH